MITIRNPKVIRKRIDNTKWWQFFKRKKLREQLEESVFMVGGNTPRDTIAYYNPEEDVVCICNLDKSNLKNICHCGERISKISNKWNDDFHHFVMTIINHEFLHRVFHKLNATEGDMLLDFIDYLQWNDYEWENYEAEM